MASSSEGTSSPDNNDRGTGGGGHGSANHYDADQAITQRFIVNSREAGGIIGKGGENVKRFREESGARINISDSSSAERIVVVVGTSGQIKKAFQLVAHKFEEDLQSGGGGGLGGGGRHHIDVGRGASAGIPSSQVLFRLIIPNTNCGSLIGKGGSNIKELRTSTGATIQVANEMLPNSTERCVSVSGSLDSIMKTLDRICVINLETKPKGPTIPYQPQRGYMGGSPGLGMFDMGGRGGMGGGGYGMAGYGGYGSRGTGNDHRLNGRGGQYGMMGDGPSMYGGGRGYGQDYSDGLGGRGMGGGFMRGFGGGGGGGRTQVKEITIPNELIGSIIGRHGSRINEIRQSSQANVKIEEMSAANDSGDGGGSGERRITISGSPMSVRNAISLINVICNRYKNSSATRD